METYDELERKMVAAVGRERTDEIRNMAKDIRAKEKECPALRQMRLMVENSSYGSFATSKGVTAVDNGFIKSCIDIGEMTLAMQFLKDIYKMEIGEAVAHIADVLKGRVVIFYGLRK